MGDPSFFFFCGRMLMQMMMLLFGVLRSHRFSLPCIGTFAFEPKQVLKFDTVSRYPYFFFKKKKRVCACAEHLWVFFVDQ